MYLNRALWYILNTFMIKRSIKMSVFPKKILVMRYGALGDVLQTTPVLSALHSFWPDAKIDYWASGSAASALSYNPLVSKIVNADMNGALGITRPLALLRHALMLRSFGYDLAVCLGTDPFYGLLAWLSGIKRRAGLILNKNKATFLQTWIEYTLGEKTGLQAKSNALMQLLSSNITAVDSCPIMFWNLSDEEKITDLLGPRDDPLIAFFPGGGVNKFRPWANRRWRTDKWVALGNKILEKRDGFRIVLFGTKVDVSVIADIVKMLPHDRIINLTEQTTFSQLAPMLKRCRLLISTDSAPVFVAAAVGCPVIVIYGPEWPERTRPSGTQLWYPAYADIECRDNCATFPAKSPICQNECIDSVTVEMVSDRVSDALENRRIIL